MATANQQFGDWYNQGQSQIPSIGLFGGQQSSIPSVPQMGGGSLQSSIPSIGGQFAMLPAGGTTSGISNDLINASRARANAAMGNSFNSSNTNMNPAINTFPGGTSGDSSIPAATGNTTIGQSSGGWLSPEEMRAKTNALQGHTVGTSGGSGSGSALGTAAKKDDAGNPIPIGQAPTQNATPNVSTGQYSGSPISYAPLNGQPGTYQAPGSGTQDGGAGALQMQQQSPGSALNDYMNTPGYQLLMTNQQNQFQQSPGYQYAVNQALGQVQNNASARGLLESGSVMREMTDRAQGMASQGYNDWWNKQNSSFNDYQNRLAGLAGGNVGGDQAFNLGQNLGQNTYQTGGDVGTLLGNQGTSGLGAISGTGAAQAGNIGNAGTQQGQIAGANASTQLAGATYNRGLF